jgi:ankyrin repeat protein
MPTPDTPDDSGETPLGHVVAGPFSPPVFHFLIGAGAHHDTPNAGGTTPLSVLLSRPTAAAVETLAACGIPLDAPGAYSFTHVACRLRDADLLRTVLRCGGDPNFPLDDTTPLDLSVFDDLPPLDDFTAFEDIRALDVSSFERVFGCAFLLCEYGASPSAVLHRALERNDQLAVFFLLLTGAEPKGGVGTSRLVHELVKFFESHDGTSMTDALIETRTPLHLAVHFAPPEVVSFLIAKGFDVDASDERGLRPIHRAVACARFASAQVLIDESASVLPPSIRYPSLLHAVAVADAMTTADAPTAQLNFPLVAAFVKHIADTIAPVDRTDPDGRTAFARACEAKNFRFAEVLLRHDPRRDGLDGAAFFANLIEATEPQTENPYSDEQLRTVEFDVGDGFIANGKTLSPEAAIQLVALYLAPEKDREGAAPHHFRMPIERQSGRTALHLACARSLCSLVRYMVLNGANPHEMEADGPSPIQEVLDAANAAVLRELITDSFEINRRDKQGRTPFAYACMHGNPQIFEILVDNGASVQTFDNEGQSPFSIACKNGNLEALDYLLQNSKILPRRADNSRRAPIHLAAKFGHLPLVKKLWDTPGMDTIRDIRGNTPLHRAVKPNKNRSQRGHIDIVKFMSANPKLALEKNRDGETPLTLAAHALDKDMVEFFFSFGLQFRPSESYHALRGALDAHDADFMRTLLANGLRISIRSGQNSIIDYAIERDEFDFLRSLVDQSAFDPADKIPLALAYLLGRQSVVDFFVRLMGITNLDDVLNQLGPELADLPRVSGHVSISARESVKLASDLSETFLPVAALQGRGVTVPENDMPSALWGAFTRKDLATMEALLDLGANPNCRNADGRPLLSQATKIGALPIVNLLLAHGASPDETDAKTGCSPVYEALTSGHMDVLFALLPYGANINTIDGRRRSALTIAIEKRKLDIFELLLDNGANPGWIDDEGRLPLHWAVEARNERACRTLLENGSPKDVADKKGHTPLKLAQVVNDSKILPMLYS